MSTASNDHARIEAIVKAYPKKELISILKENDLNLRPTDSRTKADICKSLLRLPAEVRNGVIACLSSRRAFPEANVQINLELLQRFSKDELVRMTKDEGIDIPAWLFTKRVKLVQYLPSLTPSMYNKLYLRLQTVQEPKPLHDMLGRKFESCTVIQILTAMRDVGIDTQQLEMVPKELVIDYIARQTPPVLAKLMLRLEPPRVPVLERPFLGVPDEECRRGLLSSSEAESMYPASIPNSNLLKPAKMHPAHVLTMGMLLYYDTHTRKVPGYACRTCLQHLAAKVPKRPPLALANNLWIGEVPFELRILSLCERILISRFFAAAYIVKLYPKSRGARGLPKEMLTSAVRGNVSSYFLNTKDIISMIDPGYLPPRPAILAATIGVTFIGPNNIPLKFLPAYLHVRRNRVRDGLHWLIAKNPLYLGQMISENNLSCLPDDCIPQEITDNMKWVDDVAVLDKENGGYVPNQEENEEILEEAESEDIFRPDNYHCSDSEADAGEEGIPGGDDYGRVEQAPLQALGVVDVDGSSIPKSDLFAHVMRNTSGHAENYLVKPGGFVNTYGKKDKEGQLTWGTVENPNHLLGCFPHLFPYGEGGFETERPAEPLQYADRRFRLDHQFIFQVFGVIQRREICARASLRITRFQFRKNEEAIRKLTPKDLLQASEEEKKKKKISNPAICALRSQLTAVCSKVLATDEHQASVRAQIWSLNVAFNPPSLWITINPSDTHNPIAQVFAGEQIDLDNFVSTRGPTSTLRTINLAQDPYTAAQFFHFTVRAILEVLYGFRKMSIGHPSRKLGIVGLVQAHVGMVESQGRGTLHLHTIMWLVGAPNPSEMREALKSAEFRAKVVTFILSMMRADVGKMLSELMAIKPQPSVAYQRPISPDDPQYEAKRLQQEIILAQTLQLHECVMRCKRRAFWPTSEFDYIDEDGTWRMKRTVGYLNGFNPTILETQLCNNDQKLVTNSDETQDMTYYITTYLTKKRDRSTNKSAILAQRLAYHSEQERKNGDVAEASRKLVMRCATALNRNQELSALEVISYLMGWGDRYISHTFAPIYLEGIVSCLRWYYVSLQEKRWAHVASGGGGCEVVQVSDNTAAEVEEIRLTMVSGEVETRMQLDDYCHRGETLQHYKYDAGVFEHEFEPVAVAPIAGHCTLEERVDFQEWHKELLEYTSSGGHLVVNDIDMARNIGHVVANAPPTASLRDILNEEQARVHDIVVEHLQKTIAGERPAQLLLLLQGAGGTGKTVVINAISETFERLGVKGYLAKTATTGIAASHFGGKTLHT
ncbi:hypothetical protein F5877DRAFT_84764 [Lentinula edodes]|nr:hypothetical protein F5877DRAFT_84764 [Lentinula edodes]